MLILSTSSIASFKRCRKQYQLGYEKLLKPKVDPEYLTSGSLFHSIMERQARGEEWESESYNDEIAWVAAAYVENRWEDIKPLYVDEPIYYKVDDDTTVRWTPDLVFKRGDTVVARDYKTFAKQPTLDMDLDFQGRIYIAMLMKLFDTDDVMFEYEYVRRTPPGDKWTPEQCYTRVPLAISKREAEEVWQETLWVIEDIKRTRENNHWYRVDVKGVYMGCGSCPVREACKSEAQLGYLDDQTIDLTYDRREPLKLPEGVE